MEKRTVMLPTLNERTYHLVTVRRTARTKELAVSCLLSEKWDYVFLAALTLFLFWLFAGRFSGLGTKVDWLSQHTVFPEYFRQQFYETGNLFPEFAPNIGAGENIYYFSYYGFLSPVVLFSYFLPGLAMERYMLGASVLSLMTAVLLFYRWLKNRGFSRSISFLCSLIFLLAGPMIYHTCKQVMFVNYMPFLCLSFLGVDRYFEKGKRGLFLFSVFLMIMISFYFSVGGILALILYGLYRYVEIKGERNEKIRLKSFFKDGFLFLLPIFTAVLMSSILLVPTAFTLGARASRSQGSGNSLIALFIPSVKTDLFFYGYYGIGLTTLGLTILFTGILTGFRRKGALHLRAQERVLFWGLGILLFFPFFCCLLNGGLYVRAKAMIPFLPLICYCFAWYVKKLKNREIPFITAILPYGMTILCLFLMRTEVKSDLLSNGLDKIVPNALLIESVLLLLLFVFYWKWRKENLLLVPSVLLLFLLSCILSFLPDSGYALKEELAAEELYAEISAEEIKEQIVDVSGQEEGFYRMEQQGSAEENLADINRIWTGKQYISSLYSSTEHKEYQKFRSKVFEVEEPYRSFNIQPVSKNPIFQKVMGVKYILKHSKDGWGFSENTLAAPVLFGSSRVIEESAYEKLPFPYNQTALAEYAVTNQEEQAGNSIPVKNWEQHLKEEVSEAFIEIPECAQKGTRIERTESGWKIKTKEAYQTKASIGPLVSNEAYGTEEMLFLRFHVQNNKKNKDLKISVNGMQNKQAAENHIYKNENEWFVYGLPLEPGTTEVVISFGAGEYEISDVACYFGTSCEGWQDLYESDFTVDWEKTKGNVISGNICMNQAGYLISSIPYEETFSVFVDGKKVKNEKVNTAFLGCVLTKGEHQVEIRFHASGFFLGKILSVFGCVLALVLIFIQRLHSFVECAIVHMDMKKVCLDKTGK